MIEVSRLTKRYGGRPAIEDLNFTIEKGRIYGFLGANGAGKSTTMNIITGYLAATAGTVTIGGHDIVDEPEEARSLIGYLPEQPPLYPDMTVWEYLIFASELKKIPKGDRKKAAAESVRACGLTEVKDRLIRNLSKGFRQRTGLAQALLGKPPVIILDEPTVGLDPVQIAEVEELIRGLRGEHTVLLSSHIMSEVAAVCDHVLILSKGHLVASDTPEALARASRQGSVVRITALGSEDQVRTALAGSRISLDSLTAGQEEGTVELTASGPEEEDIRADLSRALTAGGLVILEMQRKQASLTELFFELTEDRESAEEDVPQEAETDSIPGEVPAEDSLQEAETAESPEEGQDLPDTDGKEDSDGSDH